MKQKSLKKFSLLFLFFIINQNITFSQNDDRLDVEDLQPIESESLINREVSVASKSADNLQDAPGAVTFITATEIEKFGANNLVEVLERVTSIYHAPTYVASHNVISMRGDMARNHYNNHILILINGRPTRENLFGGIDYPIFLAMPLSSIEVIEIIRGPGSVLYGTNAYSGVINIITKKAQVDETSFSLKTGSFETYSFEAFSNKSKEGLQLTSAIKYFHQGGWTNEGMAEDAPFSMEMGQDNLGGIVALNYKNLSFEGFVTYSSQNNFTALPRVEYPDTLEVTLPDGTVRKTPTIGPEQGFRDRRIETIRAFANLGYDFELSSKFNLSLNSTFNATNTRFPSVFGDFVARTRDVVIEPTAFYKPHHRTKLVLGATAYYQEGINQIGDRPTSGGDRGTPPYSKFWYSFYSQLEFDLLKKENKYNLSIFLGGQYNKPNRIGGDFVPRIGLVGTFKEKYGFKLLYGQAFRAAFEAEHNFNDQSVLRGVETVSPEKVATFDAQMSYNTDNLQFIVTYFNTQQRDLISRVENTAGGTAQFMFTNVGSLKIDGLELETKIALSKNFFFKGSATYQNNTQNDTLKNATLVPQTMFKIGGFYDWLDRGLSFSLYNIYFSDAGRFDTEAGMIRNPEANAFSLLTAKLDIDILKLFKKKNKISASNTNQIKLSIYGTNLLQNKVYHPEFVRRNINSLQWVAPERGIYTSLSFKF